LEELKRQLDGIEVMSAEKAE
jgi:hypothetical protein